MYSFRSCKGPVERKFVRSRQIVGRDENLSTIRFDRSRKTETTNTKNLFQFFRRRHYQRTPFVRRVCWSFRRRRRSEREKAKRGPNRQVNALPVLRPPPRCLRRASSARRFSMAGRAVAGRDAFFERRFYLRSSLSRRWRPRRHHVFPSRRRCVRARQCAYASFSVFVGFAGGLVRFVFVALPFTRNRPLLSASTPSKLVRSANLPPPPVRRYRRAQTHTRSHVHEYDRVRVRAADLLIDCVRLRRSVVCSSSWTKVLVEVFEGERRGRRFFRSTRRRGRTDP